MPIRRTPKHALGVFPQTDKKVETPATKKKRQLEERKAKERAKEKRLAKLENKLDRAAAKGDTVRIHQEVLNKWFR